MKRLPLLAAFFLALFAALFSSAFFPNIRILAFAPFLCIAYAQKQFIHCLWLSFLCGIIMDLLSIHPIFGMHAICYTVATLVLYKQKKQFFEDKSWALALFTALFTCLSSSMELFFITTFSKKIPFSFVSVMNNVVVTSFLDALYAVVWFSYPVKLYHFMKSYILLKWLRSPSEEE